MAEPRDLLLIDIPGLDAADVRGASSDLSNLLALAGESFATMTPIASGFEHARQAAIATGLLPMHHGVVHSGQYVLRAPAFWQRAGVRAAYFGPSRMLQELADAALYMDGDNLVFKPAEQKAAYNRDAPRVDDFGDFDPVFIHFARRAMERGFRVVWLELVHLAVHQIVSIVAGRKRDKDVLRRVDAMVGEMLRAAGDRVVALFSSTTLHSAGTSLRIAEAGTRLPGDWRLLHVRCEDEQIPAVVKALEATGAYARVVHSGARGELGVDCDQAGSVVAELKPGWGFAPSSRPAACAAGPNSPPGDLPVVMARGLKLDKAAIGMCELAWMLEHALTGREYGDERA